MPLLFDRRRAAILLGLAAYPAAAAADSETPKAFQREVLEILAESFPERRFTRGSDDEEVATGNHRLYLGNLRATVGALPADERRGEIVKWISAILSDIPKDNMPLNWAAAQPLLRLHLVPENYFQLYPKLVHRPFAAHLFIASALDLARRDEYIQADRLKEWNVDEAAVHDRATENLERMSRDIEIIPRKAEGGVGRYVAVHKGDAYDAVRLLLPAFRGRLLDALGVPAFAGVPNRDFPMTWSKGFSGQARFVAQIGADSRSEPYPLTDAIFRFDRDGGEGRDAGRHSGLSGAFSNDSSASASGVRLR